MTKRSFIRCKVVYYNVKVPFSIFSDMHWVGLQEEVEKDVEMEEMKVHIVSNEGRRDEQSSL